MSTEIKFDQEVREAIKRGVDKLADAVKVTLGPKGRNVIIGRPNEDPQVTKDGVTVAKSINLDDPLENMGATIVKRVAEKSNDLAGDGTTTATVLTRAVLAEGLKLVAAGYNPIEIKRGMDYATELIVGKLNEMAIEVKIGSMEIEQIATVSANNDSKIGKIVADTFSSVGVDGAVTVQEGKGFETTVEKVDGLQFDKGMTSTYFSSVPDKTEVSLDNPYIFVVDGKLTTKEQIIAILEPLVPKGAAILVIAEDITGDALSTLIMNKMRGGHAICGVRTPGFGPERKNLANDIAVITGARLMPADVVEHMQADDVDDVAGRSVLAKIDGLSTTIMGGAGKEEDIQERINNLEAESKSDKLTSFEQKRLEIRKAKLAGGVAIISVGANSEIDMKEKKDRYDDAREAVASALEEGVVPGGGLALLRCMNHNIEDSLEPDELMGFNLMINALMVPMSNIISNGAESPEVIINEVMRKKDHMMGYNARKGEYVNMFLAGILDPKKVTRIALESASSVAGTLITTACAVIEN